jgi:hypothetical protein
MDGQVPGGTGNHIVRTVQEGRRGESKQKQMDKRAFLHTVLYLQMITININHIEIYPSAMLPVRCHSEPFAVILSAAKDLALPVQGRQTQGSLPTRFRGVWRCLSRLLSYIYWPLSITHVFSYR